MILKINATRIALLNLKKELKVAERGHKLLKDKRDGLVKKFMETIYGARDLRLSVEKSLESAFDSYARASIMIPSSVMSTAFLLPNAQISLRVKVKNIMSVAIPEFDARKDGRAFSYGFIDTTGDLDNAIAKLDSVFVDIIKLAQLEKTAEKLADEIEKTRRRVAALENVRIPNLEDTIRFITSQLEERARDAIVSAMRVKAMIVAKENNV